MRYILIGLLFVICLSLCSCALLNYLRDNASKYSEEVNKLSGKKIELEALAKKLVEKLTSGDLKAGETIAISVKLALTTQEILKITNDIADKRESERKKGVPWWWSLINFALYATGTGGVATALVRLIPGRYFKFQELE